MLPARTLLAAATALAATSLTLGTVALGSGAASAADVVTDGGFEATAGSPWVYEGNQAQRCTSACTYGAPRTGAGYARFGGQIQDGGPSQGTATQSVTLPVGVPQTLTMWVRVGQYLAGEDATLAVRYDGAPVGTVPLAGVQNGVYQAYSVALPVAATSAPRALTLQWNDSMSGPASLAAVAVDDISIGAPVTTPPPSTTPPAAAPDTVLGKTPAKKITKNSAKITFSSPAAGTTFTCKVDKLKAKSCTSPFKVKNLKPGKHKVKVTATAGGKVDPTPAVVTFTYKRP